jgi:hypothetical protein
MKGAAAIAVTDVDHLDNATDLAALLVLYEAKFLPPAASKVARAKFSQAIQQNGEEILNFHGRVNALWARAYPGGGMPEGIKTEKFIQGLRRQGIRVAVNRANPATYDEALVAAQHEKSVLDQEHYHTTGNLPGLKNIQAVNNAGEPMDINALMQEEDEEGINAITPQTQCYFCKGFGHITSQCSRRNMHGTPATAAVHAAVPVAANVKKKIYTPAAAAAIRAKQQAKGVPPKENPRRIFRRVINQLTNDPDEELFEEVGVWEAEAEEAPSDDEEEPPDF